MFLTPRRIWVVFAGCSLALAGCLGSPPAYFDSGGQTLAYRVQGEGPPLILVHGFQGTGPIHWEVPGTVARLPAPLLAIAGSADAAAAQVERLQEARPDAETLIIPGVDHNGTVFAPAFQETLETFFVGASGP